MGIVAFIGTRIINYQLGLLLEYSRLSVQPPSVMDEILSAIFPRQLFAGNGALWSDCLFAGATVSQAGAMVFYGGAVLWVGAIGFSRLYLGIQWPFDVVHRIGQRLPVADDLHCAAAPAGHSPSGKAPEATNGLRALMPYFAWPHLQSLCSKFLARYQRSGPSGGGTISSVLSLEVEKVLANLLRRFPFAPHLHAPVTPPAPAKSLSKPEAASSFPPVHS